MRTALRLLAAASLLAASAALGPQAHGTTTVTVDLELSALAAAPPGPSLQRCSVSVPAGADGEAVLEAAEQTGCIDSYSGSSHPEWGFGVECINDICQQEITYWAFFVNDTPSNVGASFYQASAGDEVEFSYQTWLGCLTPLGCHPV